MLYTNSWHAVEPRWKAEGDFDDITLPSFRPQLRPRRRTGTTSFE